MSKRQFINTALSLIQNDNSKILGLTVGGKSIKPGQVIPKAEAAKKPEISFNGASGTYIVTCLDPDAPFTSFSFLGPIVHWIQPGFIASTQTSATDETILTSGEAPHIVDYIGPGPPPGSSPHRYIFLLYEQPEGFDASRFVSDGKKAGLRARIRYDLTAFEKEANLGPILAANYFCSN